MAKQSGVISILRNGIISLTIAGFLFLALEGAVRFIAPQKLATTYVGGQTAGLRDPLLGHVNRPNARSVVKGPEFSVEYEISAQGFRDRSTYAAAKPQGVTRILLLGDSFAYGAGNDYDDIWPVILERRLRQSGRKVEIIKAGVPAYDTRTEVLYLERLYARYSPDIVVFAFLPNDLFTNQPASQPGEKKRPQAPAPATSPDNREAAVRMVSDKKSDLHLLLLARRVLMSNDGIYTRLYLSTARRAFFSVPPNDRVTRQFRITADLFSRAQEFCRQKGCKIIVLSIPQQFQVLATASGIAMDDIDLAYIDTEFSQLAADKGFAWVPLLPQLAETYASGGEDLYYRYDGHLNPAGNRAVAAIATGIFLGQLENGGPAADGPSAADQ